MLPKNNHGGEEFPAEKRPRGRKEEKTKSLKRRVDECAELWYTSKEEVTQMELTKIDAMHKSNEIALMNFQFNIMSKDISREVDPNVINYFQAMREKIWNEMKRRRVDETEEVEEQPFESQQGRTSEEMEGNDEDDEDEEDDEEEDDLNDGNYNEDDSE